MPYVPVDGIRLYYEEAGSGTPVGRSIGRTLSDVAVRRKPPPHVFPASYGFPAVACASRYAWMSPSRSPSRTPRALPIFTFVR